MYEFNDKYLLKLKRMLFDALLKFAAYLLLSGGPNH